MLQGLSGRLRHEEEEEEEEVSRLMAIAPVSRLKPGPWVRGLQLVADHFIADLLCKVSR